MELHEELLFLNEEDVLSLLTPADAMPRQRIPFCILAWGRLPLVRWR